MTDIANEQAQFILAALRIQKWAYATATWANNGVGVYFGTPRKDPAIIAIDTPNWSELSPTQKLDEATRAVASAEEVLRAEGFDPTESHAA